MKKFLKVFSSLCLVLVVGAAVLLSGCAKKFNVRVSASAGGEVLKVRSNEAVSLVGDNEVEKGDLFQVAINANDGYYIAEVVVDGIKVDTSSWEMQKDADNEDVLKYHVFAIKDVQGDHSVSVTFAAQKKNLTFNFVDKSNPTSVVDTVTYQVPCHTKFDLFNKSADSLVADLFFTSGTATSGITSVELKGKHALLYVDAYETADIAEIIEKLDAIFTAEKGCTKVA